MRVADQVQMIARALNPRCRGIEFMLRQGARHHRSRRAVARNQRSGASARMRGESRTIRLHYGPDMLALACRPCGGVPCSASRNNGGVMGVTA